MFIKIFKLILAFFAVLFVIGGCNTQIDDKAIYYDPYGNEIDMPFETLCQKVASEDYENLTETDIAGWTDEVLSKSNAMVKEDSLLENGLSYIDWLKFNDPTYMIGQFKSKSSIPYNPLFNITKVDNYEGSYPASFYYQLFISRFMAEVFFLHNDEKGNANQTILQTISKNQQTGLWYRWGGKYWNEFSYPANGGYSDESLRVKFYGLDCSGYLYQSLSNSGFMIDILNCEGYQNLNLWQLWLSKWLNNLNVDSSIANQLHFEKISVSRSELSSSVKQGDIILCKNSSGRTQHVAIGSNSGDFFHSCGTTKVTSIDDYSKSKFGFRGPKKSDINGISAGYVNFDILRLVYDNNSSGNDIKVTINHLNQTQYSCLIPSPTNLDVDEILALDYRKRGEETFYYYAYWLALSKQFVLEFFLFDLESLDMSSQFYEIASLEELAHGITHDFQYKNSTYQLCLKF